MFVQRFELHITSSTMIHFIDLHFNSVLFKAFNESYIHQHNWSYLSQHLVTHSLTLVEITSNYFCHHPNNNSRKDFFGKNSTKCISHVSVCSVRFVALYYYMYIVFKWMFHMQCNDDQCCQLYKKTKKLSKINFFSWSMSFFPFGESL